MEKEKERERERVSDAAGAICHRAMNKCFNISRDTLQGTNISHLGKRKIINSKVPFFLGGDMFVSSRDREFAKVKHPRSRTQRRCCS